MAVYISPHLAEKVCFAPALHRVFLPCSSSDTLAVDSFLQATDVVFTNICYANCSE